MAKTDIDYTKIDKTAARKQLRKANWLEGKDIVAFDTETKGGDIFMLSISGPSGERLIEDNGEILSGELVFDTLTKQRYRDNCNVFFNLKFDASAILKVLPEEKCNEIRIKGNTEYKQYNIKYIPGKFLMLKDSNGNKYEYFDVAQIFGDTLKGAVNDWLDAGQKNEENIDVSNFDSDSYIQENYEKIKKYAKQDAILTKRICWKLFSEAEQNQSIPCARPYSTGFLASQYLTSRLEHKIGRGMEAMQKMAWDSYAGGRFEVFQRGDIGEIVGPDINSAYPANLSTLPDPSSLNWVSSESSDLDIQDVKEADYGFIKAKISTNPNKTIQPFAVKINGKQTYPILESQTITVVKDLFTFALENGYIDNYEIEKLTLGYVNDQTRYPFDFMEDKYTERKQLEDIGNYNAANTIKIILNSMYGKMLQTNWDISNYDEEINPEEISDNKRIKVDRQSGISYTEELKAGPMFNPFIGTYTTALTRLQLHKTVEELDLVDNTILFATDCIMVDKEAYENSNFSELMADENESYAEQLGKWDFDYEGNAFVIGSGVYEVDLGEEKKTVTRGFGDLENMKETAAKSNGQYITTENRRPIGFNEAVHSNKLTISDTAKFIKATKKLKADFDEGREWEREKVDYNKLIQSSEKSKPVVI